MLDITPGDYVVAKAGGREYCGYFQGLTFYEGEAEMHLKENFTSMSVVLNSMTSYEVIEEKCFFIQLPH